MLTVLTGLSILFFMAALMVSGLVPMARGAMVTAQASVGAMRNPALDDDAREQAVRQASLQLFGAFFGLLLRTLAALAAGLVPIVLADLLGLAETGAVLGFMSRWDVIVVASVVVTLGVLAVTRLGPGQVAGYSATDRFLHRFALGGAVMPEVLHDVERGAFLKHAPEARDGAHIFVCGLARAGTTVLTRDLYATGAFGSLTYRDMPFVLAPNLWSRISRSSTLERTERAHGDGLQVDLDSPEALDEVYWRLKAKRDYIKDDALVPHSPDVEDLDGYVDLVRLVLLKTGAGRYLSKNNNNILRLPGLMRTFPNASFLVPVRDPLTHTASLMRQHARFQILSRFETDYVGWLGHHEFGATHLPFKFGAAPAGTSDQPDYWLRLWIGTYRHLLGVVTGNQARFVCYEDLCSDADYRADLMEAVGLQGRDFAELRARPTQDAGSFSPELVTEARKLYAEIRDRSRVG